MCNLTAPQFTDSNKAREYLESICWANGIICPHCGVIADHYKIQGKTARPGLYACRDCREQFTVTVGTVFERSKIPLNKWLLATYLLCSSKKGFSSHQLHRTLGVTYKTAWFMAHRLREAMKDPDVRKQLGGTGSVVEADETYWGNTRSKNVEVHKGYGHKEKIFSLVERNGNVRSFHVPHVSGETLIPILKAQIHRDTRVMTDEFGGYKDIGQYFAEHSTVAHSHKEYVRGDVHTNTIEGYFSILKRGLIGTFHHVGSNHLHRYINEFDFRYNHRKITDSERTDVALAGIAGKRLMYKD